MFIMYIVIFKNFYFSAVVCRTEFTEDTNWFADDLEIYYGEIVSYSCGIGYELLGDANITCLASGELSGLKPECIRKYLYRVSYICADVFVNL